jgi:putative membrane protein insertion efficiency factor
MALGAGYRRRVIWLLLFGLLLLFQTSWPVRAEIQGVRLYQRLASPVASRFITCRFEPTCSHFALAALEDKGFLEGNWLILKRLVLCSPVGYLAGGAR